MRSHALPRFPEVTAGRMAPSRSFDIVEVPDFRYTDLVSGDPPIDLEKVREFLRGKREQRIWEQHALRACAQREARAIIERIAETRHLTSPWRGSGAWGTSSRSLERRCA